MDIVEYKEIKLDQEYINDECCGLCASAHEFVIQIVEHFKKYHADSIDYENFIKTCECEEVLELRDLLINHHLANRLGSTKPIIEEVLDEDIIEEYIDPDLDPDIMEDPEDGYMSRTEQDEMETEAIVYEEYVAIETKDVRKCRECNAEYSSAKGMSLHYKNEHDPNNKIVCPECPNRFFCERKLQTHLNNHEAEKSYRDGAYFCRICDKMCINKARLIAHKKTHFQDYCCDYCGKRFTKFEFLQNHVIQHAFGKQKRDPNDLTGKIVCPLCSKFVPKDRMKRHNFIFHSNERPYVCSVEGCHKSFKYAEPYSNHMDMHHQTPKYKCEFCHKSFFNQSNLRQHKFRHLEPDKFKCEFCNDRFGSSNSLKMHIKRLHETGTNDTESYLCTIDGCGKTFKMAANLKNHINQVHKSNDTVLRKCEYCSHTCFKLKNMQKHVSRVHKIKKRDHRLFPSQQE